MMDKNSIKGIKDLALELLEEDYEGTALEAFLRGVEFVIKFIEDENEGA